MSLAKPFFTDSAYDILDPMKGGAEPNGFTIVETLIVLAVSGAMFVSAALLISGQQAKAQFRQSVNQVAQQLQQTIGDVTNGYYPTQNAKCTSVTNALDGKPRPNLTAGGGSGSLGTNSACVLVGKAVQFMSSSNSNATQHFVVYTMAGLRQSMANGNPQNITNLADAHPIAIAPGLGGSTYASVPDASVTNALGGGLSLSSITYNLFSSPGTAVTGHTPAFAAFAEPAASAGAPGGAAGSPQVGLYIINGPDATHSSKYNVSQIDNYTAASFSNHFEQVSQFTVCLAGGAVNQSGLITIDGTTAQPSVALAIKGGRTC